MRYLFIVFLFISSFLSGQGIEPTSFQPTPYKSGILKGVTPFVDEFTGDTMYIYQHVDSLVFVKDSIFIRNDSIFLRDGTGFAIVTNTDPADSTIVQNSYGTIITESPANTFNIEVDSTKFATPYDLTLIPNPPDSTVIVDGWGITSVEMPTNTYNIIADSSQVFTQYDGTLKQDKLPSFTNGSVIFSDGTNLAQDNSNLYWDDANNRLGIGTLSPIANLHVVGMARIITASGDNLLLNGGNTTLSGQENVVAGKSSGLNLTTGSFNTLIGNYAGGGITSGSLNFGCGYESLLNNNSSYNIGIGYQSLYSNSGGFNIGIGPEAGKLSTGAYNIYQGFQSGASTGSYNVGIGTYNSINATGSYNISIGKQVYAGWNNVHIGHEVASTSGSNIRDNNVLIGYQAGNNNTGSTSVVIGTSAGASNSGSQVVLIGQDAGSANTGSSSVVIGYGAGRFTGIGDHTTLIGAYAGDFNTGASSVMLGYSAGRFNNTNNALYIDNDSGTPLIGGNFTTDRVGINTPISSLANTLHVTGGARITNLGGAGTRMVITDNNGDLGNAAIPIGTVTSIATTSPITGGTITSSGTIGITQSTTSTSGFLSSTDWNTFNGKVGGSGTSNYMTKFTGISTIGNSIMRDDGTNIGLGVAPDASYRFKVGSGNAKIGDAPGTLNKLYFGDGTNVFVGEDVSDDRLYLKGTSLSISTGGSLGTSGQVLTSNGNTASWSTPTGGVTSVTASSPLASSGGTTPNITIQNATSGQTGSLTSTDWNTFNNKMNIFNGNQLYSYSVNGSHRSTESSNGPSGSTHHTLLNSIEGETYGFQIAGGGGVNDLYYRNKIGTFGSWNHIAS